MITAREYDYQTVYKVGDLVRSSGSLYRVVPLGHDVGLTAGQNKFLQLKPPYRTERGNSILLDISL